VAPVVQATDLETGYHHEILGENAEKQLSKSHLFTAAVLSVIGIFLIVYNDFSYFRLALLLMLCLPIALTGSIFAALLGGGLLSLGSIVGFPCLPTQLTS
jgi:Cu/Ag efflux pump CusA